MHHDDVRMRLSAYVDGALDAREARAIDAHLAACASCAAYLAELRSVVAVLREVEPMPAPDGFAASVRSRLEQAATSAGRGAQTVSRPLRVRWSWRTAAAAAAAAAAVAVLGVFALNVARDVLPTWRQDARYGEDGRIAGDQTRKASSPASRALPRQGQLNEERQVTTTDGMRERAPQAMAPSAQEQSGAGVAPPVASAPQVPLQHVIRTGKVSIEVVAFDDAARRMQAIADAAGGFVASSSVTGNVGDPQGTFVIRVPARRFGEATRQIEALGRVLAREYRAEDVGEEYVDIESRLRNLQRHEARLLSFMDRASRIADLVAIEHEVSRVHGEIERLVGRQRYLANRIELATIEAEVSQKPKQRPGGFWDIDRTIARLQTAFLDTVRQILGAAEGLAAFLAAVAPLALVVGAGWVVVRRALHRPDPL
jgi:hypothetical protein